MNKKGQVFEQLGQLAIGVAVLCIVLTVAFLIMDKGRDMSLDNADVLSGTGVTFVAAEDVSFVLNGGCNLERDAVVSEVWNNSVGDYSGLINEGNYSVEGYRLTISNSSGTNFNLSGINVSYSCIKADYAYNGTLTLTNATQTVPGWVPLIIITVIGGLLLGLVMMFRKRRS